MCHGYSSLCQALSQSIILDSYFSIKVLACPYNTNYVHRIGNRILHMDIPCPVIIGSYLSTITAAFFISILSFKYLFIWFIDSQIFHPYASPYDTSVQQCLAPATNLNTELHTVANWQNV